MTNDQCFHFNRGQFPIKNTGKKIVIMRLATTDEYNMINLIMNLLIIIIMLLAATITVPLSVLIY